MELNIRTFFCVRSMIIILMIHRPTSLEIASPIKIYWTYLLKYEEEEKE